jgi:hypothetical protein
MSNTNSDIGKCPDCNAKIKFTCTDRGTLVPVDIDLVAIKPHLRGGIAIVTPEGRVIVGKLAMAGERGAIQGYTSHSSTCRRSK